MLYKRLRKIAWNVREWIEERNYHSHSDLGCMCAIATAEVFRRLKRAGIEAEIGCNDDHCFVVSDGYIVDVTATQFDQNAVVVRKLETTREWFWKIDNRFKSVRDLVYHQVKTRWPSDQMATYTGELL